MLQQYINIPKVRGDLKVKDFSRYETADLHAKDLKHNMHPFTDFASFKKEGSLIMAESDGAYVYDTEGKNTSTALQDCGVSISVTASKR